MLDVLTIGDTTQDVFLNMTKENAHVYCEYKEEDCQLCFNYCEKIPVQSKKISAGGNAANAAVSFARLGLNTGIYAHVGDDDTGKMIVGQLKKNKVKTDYIHVDNDKESNYNTVISIHGERTILTYHEKRDYHFNVNDAAKWVYFTSMSCGFDKVIKSVIDYIIKYKVKLVLQPGTFQIKSGAEVLSPLLHHAHLMFLNKEEAQVFCDLPDEDSPEALLRQMRAMGPHIAVLTDGDKGAFVSDGKRFYHLEPDNDLRKVDTTGAGDAYSSGFTAALINGESIETAMTWGQLAAAACISEVGAQTGLLKRSELDNQLDQVKFNIQIT